MRNRRTLGIFGGNDALLQAIIGNDAPLSLTTGNREAQREAKSLDEKESETRWNDERRLGPLGVWQRKNAKRKGIRRNDQEQRTINRL